MTLPKIESFKGFQDRLFWADATGDTLAEVVTPVGSYFVPDYAVLDVAAAHNKLLLVTALRNPFVVSFWGSHPDDENDDCWTGSDYTSIELARQAFREECFEHGVAYILLDGPGVHEIRKNPHFVPTRREREDAAERSERAMQAGMAFGCEGYNDELGYG